jgi:hypothetical protein
LPLYALHLSKECVYVAVATRTLLASAHVNSCLSSVARYINNRTGTTNDSSEPKQSLDEWAASSKDTGRVPVRTTLNSSSSNSGSSSGTDRPSDAQLDNMVERGRLATLRSDMPTGTRLKFSN